MPTLGADIVLTEASSNHVLNPFESAFEQEGVERGILSSVSSRGCPAARRVPLSDDRRAGV